MPELTGQAAVEVDGITVEAPGLGGNVVVERGEGATTRDLGDQLPAQLRRAMRRQEMRPRRTIRIRAPREAGPAARGGIGEPAPKPPPIRVTVPAPRKGRAQVVLSRDEHGITTWHFPTTTRSRGDIFEPTKTRTQTFEIPRTRSESGEFEAGARGFPGLSKILQVVTFPIAKVAGKIIEFKVREWDRKKHPPQVRAFGKDRSLTAIDDAAWKRLESGRALLFIHGTFDTTSGAFNRLPDATLAELHKRYGGRVIAFDHPTIADDPIDNARAFLTAAGTRKLDVDVVCHSRGGLVTRSIAERPGDLATVGPNVTVGTAVLIGATTNGTILADADNWNEMVDRLTTLLSFVPVPVAVDALETLFGLVRSIAVETAHDLKGLSAMAPDHDFLKGLNKTPRIKAGSSYKAVTSDYEPNDPDLKAFFTDEFKDVVMFKGPNDGMVAIDSILGTGLTGPFPITVSSAYGSTEAVEHADYFGQPKTSTALLDWLKG
jgi:pimeloyl-ACP methyl ester carboxylesterase